MDWKKTLTNPWILGGGAVLGVAALLFGGGGDGESDNSDYLRSQEIAGNINVQLAEIGAGVQSAQYSYLTEQADSQAQLAAAAIAAKAAMEVEKARSMTEIETARVAERISQRETNAGVRIAEIEGRTARDISDSDRKKEMISGFLDIGSKIAGGFF